MFDNVAQLIVFSTILIHVFDYPAEIVLTRMLPGTAFGVLVGDLIYSWLAFRLARRTGRDDVTAMPLGIDTVSLFGLTFGALGPVYRQTGDAVLAWQVGMALMVMMGVFKIAVTWLAARLRDVVPAAAMLGTIGAIGVGLIAFMPMLKLFANPLVGLVALFLILLALLARTRLPGNFLPVLAIVALCTAAFYGLQSLGYGPPPDPVGGSVALGVTWPIPTLGFLAGFELALDYLPLALPLAFATIIGGIDNTESANAAGDPYDTRSILLTEGFSTLVAGLVGGVIQTTPYIGHPAYKQMGGRAAYTIATALFVGLGGIFGYLSWLVHALPEVVVVPILVYIGLEIGGQAFLAVPRRHAAAVAICFLPILADVLLILGGEILDGAGATPASLPGATATTFKAIQVLAAGFVFTAMLYGSVLAFLIDGRFGAAAATLVIAAVASLFGVIHSPLPGGATFLPWRLEDPMPYAVALGYAATALLVWGAALLPRSEAAHDDSP
ncbi:MAG: MFS transporter [Deltaproteobacteria bacterium]|nr:MFS transporter [Deltaproteobacteria bacterium]